MISKPLTTKDLTEITGMSDPGLITASQLISAAEERARHAEVQAKYAEDRAQKAEQKRDELLKELASLKGDAPLETRQTAERLVSRLYDSFERANWDPYDDEDDGGIKAYAIKDYLIGWLARALERKGEAP